ncbi:MAG: hypothetical protein J1G30_03670 [Spirochaetales bacterium]|nr:hypothetical protein [Spirochaetales bacterium]
MGEIILGKDPSALKEKNEQIKDIYHIIEVFFMKKAHEFEVNEQFSVDSVLADAPSYYSLIHFFECFYAAITKNENWLENYINKKKINFNWKKYKAWVAGKQNAKRSYNDTLCPSSWITELINMFAEMLKMLQDLLVMEVYLPDEDFKTFLRKNPVIEYKYKANLLQKSPPSQDIDVFFRVINALSKAYREADQSNYFDIDTAECIKAYRFIDESDIMNILKQKDFYVTFHLEMMQKMPKAERYVMPDEDGTMATAEKFHNTYKNLFFAFNEYKKLLTEKQNRVRKIIK